MTVRHATMITRLRGVVDGKTLSRWPMPSGLKSAIPFALLKETIAPLSKGQAITRKKLAFIYSKAFANLPSV